MNQCVSEVTCVARVVEAGAEVDEIVEVVGAVEPERGEQQHVEHDGCLYRPPEALASLAGCAVRVSLRAQRSHSVVELILAC